MSKLTKSIYFAIIVLIMGMLVYKTYSEGEIKKEVTKFEQSSASSDILGVIYIPRISQKIPIYKTQTEVNLSRGVIVYARGKEDLFGENDVNKIMANKILDELSLDPKINKHIVILGHSGTSISNVDLFLHLEKLKLNDEYTINNGHNLLTFKVVKLEKCEAKYLNDTLYQDGFDSSLVTCIPVHINSHRLIVRGKLIKQEVLAKNVPKIEEKFNLDIYTFLLILFFNYCLVRLILDLCDTLNRKRGQKVYEVKK